MKPLSQIYEEAAELIASGMYFGCCGGISFAADTNYMASYNFTKMYYKDSGTAHCYYFGELLKEETTNHRVTALLFLAEMYREE